MRYCWVLYAAAIVCFTSAIPTEKNAGLLKQDLKVQGSAADPLALAEIVSQVDPDASQETIEQLQGMLNNAKDEKQYLLDKKAKADEEYENAHENLVEANEAHAVAIENESAAKAATDAASANKEAAEITESNAKTHQYDVSKELEYHLPVLNNEISTLEEIIKDLEGLQGDTPAATLLMGGESFIKLGPWRIGDFDGTHFSFAHCQTSKTAVIFRSDGTVHSGPRSDYNVCSRPLMNSGSDVIIGNGFLEFSGLWRLGQVNENHFSLSHKNGNTSMIWRGDGTRHPGPRQDWNTWSLEKVKGNGGVGDEFVQLGSWRVGSSSADSTHMSIYHMGGKTAVIYRSDGTIHPGPRDDYKVLGDVTSSF